VTKAEETEGICIIIVYETNFQTKQAVGAAVFSITTTRVTVNREVPRCFMMMIGQEIRKGTPPLQEEEVEVHPNRTWGGRINSV
jgi:hypothetical protein